MRRAWVLLAVSACFHPTYDHTACSENSECPAGLVCRAQLCVSPGADGPPSGETDAAPGIDAAPVDTSATVDTSGSTGSDAQACFGHGLVQVCFVTVPSDPITLTSAISPYDTDIDANCSLRVASGGIELCVVAGRTVTVPSAFVAIGARPLVVVGIEDVTIESAGVIDVSSKTGMRKGAGANTGTCSSGAAGEDDAGGAGGGGGGGLGTVGGQGGEGDDNRSTPVDGTAVGGAAGMVQAVTTLRGGCPGSKGGNAGSVVGGAGGDGGGAVYVIAGRTLTIAGAVFASGGGGAATSTSAGIEQGGGGGGAGGVIGLDAPALAITGIVAANGGAGAGGGAVSTGGKPGENGTTTLWNTRARHGDAAQDNEGVGADGTALGKTDLLTPPSGTGGGGGGAGGLGVVWLDGALTGGTQISPAPTLR